MKTNQKLLAFLILIQAASADVIYVDNDSVNPADFRTIQEAHDAATEDDVILVAPSTTHYESIVITKKIILRGNGFGAVENNFKTADVRRVIIPSIDIGNSDGGDQAAEGAMVDGIESPDVDIFDNRCIISNSIVEVLWVHSASSVVRSCQCGSLRIFATGSQINNSVVNSPVEMSSNSTVSANHCILKNGITKSFGNDSVFNISNSIIGETSDPLTGGNIAVAKNCLFYSGVSYTPDNGNITDTTANTFIDLNRDLFGTQYKLKSGSPALTAATDGGQVGIFGGSTPFIVGAFPAVPRIIDLEIRSANTTSGITFKVEAEARQ